MKFMQAKHCGPSRDDLTIDLIVIHTIEAPEKGTTAESTAAWFAGPSAPQASAHYCVDTNSVVQCVEESVVAWAAPGANRNGIHIEHAGYARQTAVEWADPASEAILQRSAALAANIAKRHGIPIVRALASDLKAGGARGFTGHVDVTWAFSNGKGHWDPGPHFPWDHYLDLVRAFLRDTEPPPPPGPDDVA